MRDAIRILATLPRWFAARLVTLSRLYLTVVAGWAVLYAQFGDRWWWLYALNSIAICLFAPLPLILALGLAQRRRDVIVIAGTLLLLSTYLYGATFLPRPRAAPAGGPTLTVMSFNMLGFNQHPDAVVAALRASQADLIGIQELSASAAQAIQGDLATLYPYQALDPQPGVFGMGVISRYPLRQADVPLPGHWIGVPQALTIEVGATRALLVNVHALPLLGGSDFNLIVREREATAQTIAALGDRAEPLIVTGDFNTTSLSAAYRTVTGTLGDSWRDVGWGFGGTFPGGIVTLGTPSGVTEIAVPMWVTRIDYVFHSRDWVAVSSRIGPWDGYSDHRPVIATLTLAATD